MEPRLEDSFDRKSQSKMDGPPTSTFNPVLSSSAEAPFGARGRGSEPARALGFRLPRRYVPLTDSPLRRGPKSKTLPYRERLHAGSYGFWKTRRSAPRRCSAAPVSASPKPHDRISVLRGHPNRGAPSAALCDLRADRRARPDLLGRADLRGPTGWGFRAGHALALRLWRARRRAGVRRW